MIKKNVYAVLDVEMNAFTDPIVLRNDVEAKKIFQSWLKKDFFNGCPVEMYCIGEWHPEDLCPFKVNEIRRIFIEDTVDDVEEVSE